MKNSALKWGPLGFCPIHNKRYETESKSLCIWNPSCIYEHSVDSPCQWIPYEPVKAFVWLARKMQTILDIFTLLREKENVPEKLWEILFGPRRHWNNEFKADFAEINKDQGVLISALFSGLLIEGRAGGLYCERDKSSAKPSLRFSAGRGFFRGVLVELASLVTGAYIFSFRCENCGNWILPGERLRAPKKGQRVYCSGCKNARVKFSRQRKRNFFDMIFHFCYHSFTLALFSYFFTLLHPAAFSEKNGSPPKTV